LKKPIENKELEKNEWDDKVKQEVQDSQSSNANLPQL